MRITVEPSFNVEYVRAKFMIQNTTIDSELMDENQCIIVAERLRQGADSLEHWSRVISDKKKSST